AAAGGQFMGLLANAVGGSYNGLVAGGDNALIFGPFGSTSFFLGPWSNTASGLTMNAFGNVGLGVRPGTARFTSSLPPTSAGEFELKAASPNGPFVGTLAGSQGGSYNPMVQNQDNALIFGGTGVFESGGLVIGPWTNSSRGVRLDALGNVGVGTASPAERLD